MRLPVTLRHAAVAVALSLAAAASAGAQPPVTVPIRVWNNHVYLRVMSGSQELWFLLDTGAPLSVMNLPVADALGVKRRTDKQVNFKGVGPGSTAGAALEGVRVVVPEDTTLGVTIRSGMDMIQLNTLEGQKVDGILGRDFIEQRVLGIDYAEKRIVFQRFGAFHYAGSGDRVPFKLRANYPTVVAEMGLADGGTVKATVILDVGAGSALVLNKPIVERHKLLTRVGPTIRRVAGAGAGGAAASTTGRVPRLRIGKTELPQVIVALYGDSAGVFSDDEFFEGNIGGEILRRFNVIFDYSRKEVILEPNAAFGQPFAVDLTGMLLRLDTLSGGFRVANMMQGGPAQLAGMMRGDLIVSVDGKPALEYGLGVLRRRFTQDGGDVVLVIKRGDEEITVRLPIRRLV